MDQDQLDYIKTNAADSKQTAQTVLDGDRAAYEGNDAPREIVSLCETIEQLLAEIKPR